MRLTDLNPSWVVDAVLVLGGTARTYEGRHGMVVSFECPCCLGTHRATRLAVWFANPIDGEPATDDATTLWQREGESFETLTLSPSVDASEHGHWHGFIREGAIA